MPLQKQKQKTVLMIYSTISLLLLVGVPNQKSWLNPSRYNYMPSTTTIHDKIAT